MSTLIFSRNGVLEFTVKLEKEGEDPRETETLNVDSETLDDGDILEGTSFTEAIMDLVDLVFDHHGEEVPNRRRKNAAMKLLREVTRLEFIPPILHQQSEENTEFLRGRRERDHDILVHPWVSRREIAQFFGGLSSLQELELSGGHWDDCGDCVSLPDTTKILNNLPPNTGLERFDLLDMDPDFTHEEVQNFATALSKHSDTLKVLNIWHCCTKSIDDDFFQVPLEFGPVLRCISTIPLVKLGIGSRMDFFTHWANELPQVFQGLQQISIDLDCCISEFDPRRTNNVKNALRLMEEAVNAAANNGTNNNNMFTVAFKADDPLMDKEAVGLERLKAPNAIEFYSRICTIYKEKNPSLSLTINLDWYDDFPIISYATSCAAVFGYLNNKKRYQALKGHYQKETSSIGLINKEEEEDSSNKYCHYRAVQKFMGLSAEGDYFHNIDQVIEFVAAAQRVCRPRDLVPFLFCVLSVEPTVWAL